MKQSILFLLLSTIALSGCSDHQGDSEKVNFLFCIADDWSYPHAGVYGDSVARTPNFDRIANEGILFNHAFTAASSCTPSRAAILTGQDIFRLESGGCLFGTLPQKFPVYTTLLEQAGYHIGFTGKGYGPTDISTEGWDHNPAGHAFQDQTHSVPEGIRETNYAANFKQFLNEKGDDTPFCFWYGASEPHRRYKYGIGNENGYELNDIKVPGFLPDHEQTRNDVADYYYEVEWFDDHLGKMIKLLEDRGELENTVIVVTSDNGMPFPRAKSNCYNYGVQMPLAIRWGGIKNPGRTSNDLVSLLDIAPTFLEITGQDIPEVVTGKSLVPIIKENDLEHYKHREFVVTALERHTIARPNYWGYPIRAIHTDELTYIENFEPDRWPAGDPDIDTWPQGFYGDIDDGASKTLFEENPENWPDLFSLAFEKRPAVELYFVEHDLFNLNNMADSPEYTNLIEELKSKLHTYLREKDDPRINGDSPWDQYEYTGRTEWEL